MALVFNRNRVGVENTSTTVGVPDNPVARLMYYLNCMCTVLSLDQMDPNIRRLTNYEQFFLLNETDKAILLLLCVKLNPKELTGQCLILDENVRATAGRDNEFYNINAESMTFAAVDSVFVGEKRVAVKKVMVYNAPWLFRNYVQPMSDLLNEMDDSDEEPTYQQTQYRQPAVTYNQHRAITYDQPYQPSYTRQTSNGSSCCVIL